MSKQGISFDSEPARWQAVLDRDQRAVNQFFYAVKTTGVYCRPDCASRRPSRQNVLYFLSADAAEQHNFRPCKRCCPRQAIPPATADQATRSADLIAEICRRIEESEERPQLAALAESTGLSPFHLHRVFKQVTSMTPAAYWRFHQQNMARRQLHVDSSVTAAIYAAGYNSSGRFYEAAPAMLGMRPRRYRRGGECEVIATAIVPCSLGQMLVAGTARGVCAILLGDDAATLTDDLNRRFPNATHIGGDAQFRDWVDDAIQLVESAAHQPRVALPLDLRGTIFQCQVWEALKAIPTGENVTYGELAKRIGRPSAVRAVAAACGANPVAIAIPCHRVVGASGELTGYRWGVERKRRLLDTERQK